MRQFSFVAPKCGVYKHVLFCGPIARLQFLKFVAHFNFVSGPKLLTASWLARSISNNMFDTSGRKLNNYIKKLLIIITYASASDFVSRRGVEGKRNRQRQINSKTIKD